VLIYSEMTQVFSSSWCFTHYCVHLQTEAFDGKANIS